MKEFKCPYCSKRIYELPENSVWRKGTNSYHCDSCEKTSLLEIDIIIKNVRTPDRNRCPLGSDTGMNLID